MKFADLQRGLHQAIDEKIKDPASKNDLRRQVAAISSSLGEPPMIWPEPASDEERMVAEGKRSATAPAEAVVIERDPAEQKKGLFAAAKK